MLEKDKLDAYGPFILVQRLPVDLETREGLALPENQRSKNLLCRVLSVGSGEWVNGVHVKSELVPGDIVSVRQFEGRSINLDREARLVHMEAVENVVRNKPWSVTV